jgi:hypothetical protein
MFRQVMSALAAYDFRSGSERSVFRASLLERSERGEHSNSSTEKSGELMNQKSSLAVETRD